MSINVKEDFFEYVKRNPDCKIIVYGMGSEARKNYKDIGHIDYFCDQRAGNIEPIEDIPSLLPEELKELHERMVILICILKRDIAEQVCLELNELQIDAEVFHFFRNPAFSWLSVHSHLLPLAAIIRSKIAEKRRCNIIDIGGDGRNYFSLARAFGSEHLKYHAADVQCHEKEGTGLEILGGETIELLNQADICLLTVSQHHYSDLLKTISGLGIEYIFIVKYIPKSGIEDQNLNRSMYDMGYDICFDLLQRDRFTETGAELESDDKSEYRSLLYQTRKSRIFTHRG